MLIGVGHLLRIYDLGKKKMLRKCESRSIPYRVVKIITAGSRIIAFDQQESAFFIKYRVKENQLTVFADDTYPRYVSRGAAAGISNTLQMGNGGVHVGLLDLRRRRQIRQRFRHSTSDRYKRRYPGSQSAPRTFLRLRFRMIRVVPKHCGHVET